MSTTALTRATSNTFAAPDSFSPAADSFSTSAAESLYSRAAGPVSRAAGTVSRAAAGTMSRVAEAVSRAAGTAARKHPRGSVLAASAAAAGMLGASGFALGAAPWSQAFDQVASVAQGGGKVATGHPGAFAYDTLASGNTGGSELDALRSAAASLPATGVGFGWHAKVTTPAAATPVLSRCGRRRRRRPG